MPGLKSKEKFPKQFFPGKLLKRNRKEIHLIMKNIIFFDLDGTLISEDKNQYVPDSAKLALSELHKNGNLLFINSGRTLSEIEMPLRNLGFDGIACGCGTYIQYNGKVLFEKHIPQELADEISRDLQKYRLEWLLEGSRYLYYSTEKYETHIGDFQKQHLDKVPEFTKFAAPGSSGLMFDKFCICTRPDSDMEGFRNKYKSLFDIIDRGNGFYEIVPSGVSKATSIKFLMDYFDIPLENTYAIGDSTNDLSMLTFAGNSICMGNGSEEVKKAVSFVTDDLYDDGLYNAFRHFGLI